MGAAVGPDRAARTRRPRGAERRWHRPRNRARHRPGRDGVACRAPHGRRRLRGRRPRTRSGEDRRRRTASRHRPRRCRVRPRLRPPARRARVDGRARRAQPRRARRLRRGHAGCRRTRGGAGRRDRRRRGRPRARGMPASRRRPLLGRAARRRDRAESRVYRRCGGPRLEWRDAVPDDVVPRTLGDSGPEDHRPRARRRRALRARPPELRMSLLLAGAHVVTMDDVGMEHEDGWVLVADGHVAAVGGGSPPEADERVDLGGAVVTPGLVNTHHHLYQTLTRARAQEADLFTWLKTLYPVWAGIDEESVYAAARTGLAELALSGCTTVFDHHYVFPRGTSGLIEAEVRAARELGVRIVASRGSMDLGESEGGLPPDSLVEPIDDVLADTERLAALADGDGRVQIAVAPCSPFSVTGRLMTESAELARRLELPLHTHLAETVEEEDYCRELYGCRPVEYLEQLGWLADDVWCAHCVHLNGEDIE